LNRATGLFSDPRVVDTEGGHEIYFRLSEKLESKVRKYAQKVAFDSAKSAGWKGTKFTEKPGHVHFFVERLPPAPDRSAQKTYRRSS